MTFDIHTKYADADDAQFVIRGRFLYINSATQGSLFRVNIDEPRVSFPNEMIVKNYSENEGLEDELLRIGLLAELTGAVPYYYNKCNRYTINAEILDRYTR